MPATDSAIRPRGRCALKRRRSRSTRGNYTRQRRHAASSLRNYAARIAASSCHRQFQAMARYVTSLLLAACLPLAGCETVALALVGAGASSAIRYNLDGVIGRTFTAPLAVVKSASVAALERMGLSLDGTT